jgi:hypothetical protein
MVKKIVAIIVLAFGPAGGTLSANGQEQRFSADLVSSLALAAPPHPESVAMAGSLRVHGDAEAVQLDVRHATIADVLSALAANFNISYRSSGALNEELNGRYAGSLGQVLSRVLDGYNYLIKRENSKFSIVIFERGGEQAVAAPSPHPVSQHRAQIRDSR